MPNQKTKERWVQILTTIHDAIEDRGFPPTVREIGAAVGLSSSSTVAVYLEKMQNAGLIDKDPAKPRTLEVTPTGLEYIGVKPELGIPVVGTVAAGIPITAQQNIEEYFPIPTGLNYDEDELFMLRVQGSSMIKIGILNGDRLIIKKQADAENGQIVVAMTEDSEATVKRFYREDGHIRLHPENDDMDDMYFDDVSVLGLVVGLYRDELN
jgi:repressor LexA